MVTRSDIPADLQDWHGGQVSDPEIYRKRLVWRFWNMVNTSPGQGPKGDCWEWKGSKVQGYGQIGVISGHLGFHPNKFGKAGVRAIRAHALAYRFIYGHEDVPFGSNIHICHKCNNKACVRDEHLFRGTPAKNVHHAQATGLMPIARPKPEREQVWVVSGLSQWQRDLLRATRRERKLGFMAICRMLDIDISHLSRLETGKAGGRGLEVGKMICLLQMLGIDRDEFGLSSLPLSRGHRPRACARFRQKYTDIKERRMKREELLNLPTAQRVPKWLQVESSDEYYEATAFRETLIEVCLSVNEFCAQTGMSQYYAEALVRGDAVNVKAVKRMREFTESLKREQAA